MPEIKKVFLRGKMNKDLDERLLPDGEYRDASNIQISSTEGSDAGTVQNILGNRYTHLDTTVNPAVYVKSLNLGGDCIGIIENTETEKIYLFVKGTSVDAIVEYNEVTNTYQPVLIEDRSRSNPPPVLNFTDEKLTGITILEDFLIFTDNNSEPKIIDISTDSIFIAGSTDYTTTTQINEQPFIESDITLIRKAPLNAPKVKYDITWPAILGGKKADETEAIHRDKFVRFAYRWKFNNGQYSTYSPFSNPVFLPSAAQDYDINEGYNESMFNNLTGASLVNIEYGDEISSVAETVNNIKSVDILYKESNNTNVYLYKRIKYDDIKTKFETGIDISKSSKKGVISDDQLLRAYDNVPHKAKAVDVVGNRLVFANYVDGLNLDDYNPEFNIALKDRENINTEPTRQYLNAAGTAPIGATTTASIEDTATIKSGREYQIGVIFQDEFGRKSPVLTNETGYKKIFYHTGVLLETPNPDYGKKFNVKNTNGVPLAAYKDEDINEEIGSGRIKKFRYYIKSSSNNYNNIIVQDVKKDLEDPNTLWLVVPSYEINKIKEGQFMMFKKALNSNTPLASNQTVSTNTLYAESDFKIKALDISESKPENIDASETFDGKFFIKIKKNSYVLAEVYNNQGLAGSNGEKNDSEFNQVNSVPANALFLGEVQEPHEDDFYQYYFKDGEVKEVRRGIPENYSVVNVFNSSHFSGSVNHATTYAELIGANSTYTNGGTSSGQLTLGTQPHLDLNGTITKVEVKFNTAGFPTDFRFTYSSSGAAPDGTPAVFETIPDDDSLDIYYETPNAYDINEWGNSQGFDLDFFNAFTMQNGVESSIIADDFNEDKISNGVKVSTIIDKEYAERTKESSLIYSGIFNDETDINKLNEFNTGLKITKELNPEYGSIQKLHTRNTDLIALCEDKILRILANKDALFNADGNVNLTSTQNVLGQAVAYNGDYGISKNPESFANYGYRSYFTDKSRGVVIRLSKDGLTVISDKGMSSFFRENLLNENSNIIGSYDIYSDQYILSLPSYGSSISFKENVDGWVSRLSFIPDGGVSLNGNYYTCYQGELYLHHADSGEKNQFYSNNVTSGIKLIFNQEPSVIKNFKNIIYEGTAGWSVDVEGVKTDQQDGEVIEFKEKEGKYFGLISGINSNVDTISGNELDSRLKDFSIQGLGNISSHSGTETFGCANAGLSINSGIVGAAVTGTVALGTIQSISPATYRTGTVSYTATILVPSGYDNTNSTIPCSDSAGATNAAFTCTDAALNIADGVVGTTVSGTVAAGTIASYSPTTYSSNVNTEYKATINIPSGYTNSGTIECEDESVVATTASCAFSLTPGSSYSAGNYTLQGNFSGTNYTNSDTVTLSVGTNNGNIGIGSAGSSNSVNTTKSALAGQLTIYTNQGVTVTATITSGLCSGETATTTAPQSATVVINGSGGSFTYNNITLTASTTGTVTSHQWYKGTSSNFTPSASNLIAGATGATLTTQETTAATKYYKVKINGSTDSASHSVVYSNRPLLTLRFIAGSSVTQGACSSGTTKTIYANNASFTSATEFYTNIQGSTTGFEQGTYSNSTSDTNNHHRFISSGGVPQSAIGCAAAQGLNQGIRASKCNDANFDRYFNVDLGSGSALVNGNVISFTSQQFGNDYWYVENASYTGSFDASPTLANTHSSCTLMLTPVIDVTSPVNTSFIHDAGNLITRTLSAATRSNQPQGITPTFQWQGGTAANSLSDISGATSETLDVTFNTVSNSAGQPTFYNCNVKYQDGSDIKIVADTSNATITWNNFTTYTNLNYVNGGSASSPDVAACTNTSSQITLYGNSTSIGTVTQFYRNLNGSASPAVTVGSYSNGTQKAYVLGGGAVASAWSSCSNFVITGGDGTNSSYASVVLTAEPTGFSGTQFVWTANGTQVQTGSSNTYTASVATTFSGTVIYRCTVSGGSTPSGITNPAAKTLTWAVPTQKVTAQLCPAGVTHNFNITNASNYQVNQVINLTGSGFTDGCYKVTNANYTGTDNVLSAQVTGSFPFQPSASCCDCTTCSVTLSRSGAATVVVNTNVTLTAASSGFTATNYAWYSKTTPSASYSNTPIQTGSSNQLQNQSSGSAGSIYYKVIATATGVSREAEITQSWFANNPVERFYTAQSFQSNCSDDDEVITVRYTSVNALSSGTVFELGSTVVTCYKITGSGSGDSTMDEIQTFHNSCTACQNANQVDCSFSLSSSGSYNSSAGTDTITGTFGSGHTGTVSVGFSVSSGTVSPTSATKSALQSGVTLTLSPNVTLTGTISSSDACTGDTATVTIPQSQCNSVTAYYSNSNPATNTTAANDLCGNGNARSLHINGTTLGNSTQVYSQAGCSSVMSGPKYYSTDNSTYYIWNGYTLAGPYNLNCP